MGDNKKDVSLPYHTWVLIKIIQNEVFYLKSCDF